MEHYKETLQRVGFRRDVLLNNPFQASRRDQSPSPSDIVRNMSDDGDEFDPSRRDPDYEHGGGRDLELAHLRPEYLSRVSSDNKPIEESFLTWRSNTQSYDDAGSVIMEYREPEGTFKSQAPEDEAKGRIGSPKRKGLEMPEECYVTKRSRSESLGNEVELLEEDVLCCNANIRAPAQDTINRFDHCPPKRVAVVSGGDGDLSSAGHGDGDHLGFVVQNENGVGDQYSSSLGLYHKNIIPEGLRPSFMVGGEKNGSNEILGLALDCVEVEQCSGQEENGVKGSMVVTAQGADLIARDTVRSLQTCTDLTDLLDALSEDSDEGEGDQSMDWAQEGAEIEARNVFASSQKNPMEMPRGRDSIHGTHLSSQQVNCSSILSAPNSAPAKAEGGVSCQEGNVLSELTVPSAVSKECRDEFPEGEPDPSSGAPHQHVLPIKEAVDLRSEGCNVRLPSVAESLAIHTIDVAVNLTRKVDDSGAPTPQAENNLERSGPDVVILDSDSDEEELGGHGNMYKSAELKNSVELEQERIRGNLKRGIEMVQKDEEGYPVLSSITSSGNFLHLVPPLSLRHGDPSHAACTFRGSSPFRDGNSHGHTLLPWNGLGQDVTPAYEAGPSNVYNHQFHANTHNHIPATGQEGTAVIGKVQEGPRLSLLEQLRIRSKMSNPTQPMLPQVHTSANAHNQPGNSSTLPVFNINDRQQTTVPPLQNGQGAGSGREGLVQVNQAFASTSQQPVWTPYPVAFFFQNDALAGSIHTGSLSREQGPGKSQAWPSANVAEKERVSPSNAFSPQSRPDDKFYHPRSSVIQNRPSTSKTPSQERNSSLKNHSPWQQEVRQNGDGQAQSPLPHGRNSEPQISENSLQLVIVQPNHDTTLTTPREAVRRTMDMYNFCVQEAQLKIEEQRLISAHSSFQTDQPSASVPNVRVDIQAYREVKKENMDVNRNLIVGYVPGIEVGDVFNFRHQMAVVGLHHLPNVGIAYGYPDPDKDITATAVACVPKGGYNDNIDDGHSVLYTGQGGRSERSHAAPFVEHQKLEKGNKALWSNFQRQVPVRMIRGHANLSSPSNRKVLGYTYDGLYMIVAMDYSVGVGGFKVFKFKMERMEGQPPISPCLVGCTAHPWNDASQQMVVPAPLQMVEPEEETDVRQILGVEEADKSAPEDTFEVLESEVRCKFERPN